MKEKQEEQKRIITEKLGFLSGFVALEQIEVNGNKADFMKRMDDVVTKHISDEKFSVSDLAKELSMGHTTLGRYSLSSFGVAPNEYIKTKRLAVASKLLMQGGLSISEIAYRCGFSSPSYFAKCYKDAYGVTPSSKYQEK